MIELRATTRQSGKGLGTLRASGFVPAVLYGPDIEPLSLAVDRIAFERVFAETGESSLVRLVVERRDDVSSQGGFPERPFIVLIRDVQRDPIRNRPIHLDFHAVRLNEEIKIAIPIEFVGVAPIEERGEGVVAKELRELEVEALPEKLPHEITVDLSRLTAIDETITIADVTFPDGVRAVAPPETIIARAAPLVSEEELAALETPPEEGVEKVEVVKEKKEGEEVEEGGKGESNEAASSS
jgi:large subunit ribosomal protein L25